MIEYYAEYSAFFETVKVANSHLTNTLDTPQDLTNIACSYALIPLTNIFFKARWGDSVRVEIDFHNKLVLVNGKPLEVGNMLEELSSGASLSSDANVHPAGATRACSNSDDEKSDESAAAVLSAAESLGDVTPQNVSAGWVQEFSASAAAAVPFPAQSAEDVTSSKIGSDWADEFSVRESAAASGAHFNADSGADASAAADFVVCECGETHVSVLGAPPEDI